MPVDDWKIAEPFRAPFGAYPTNRNIFFVKKLDLWWINRIGESVMRGAILEKTDVMNFAIRVAEKQGFGVWTEDRAMPDVNGPAQRWIPAPLFKRRAGTDIVPTNCRSSLHSFSGHSPASRSSNP